MVSREHKRAAMHRKLKLLRSITNSHAQTKTSVILEARRYIEQLKQKVERLHQNIAVPQINPNFHDPMPKVKVESREKDFLILVLSETSCCTGLLVYILEALEELGIELLQARVSCSENFHLEANGCVYENQGQRHGELNAERVSQALAKAIQSWSKTEEQEYLPI